jgi:hypothetical protein
MWAEVSFPACPPWSDKRSLLPPGRPASASLSFVPESPPFRRVPPTSSVFPNMRSLAHDSSTRLSCPLWRGSPCSSNREKSELFAEMCTERRALAVAATAISSSFEASISHKWESSSHGAPNVIALGRSTKISGAFSGCRRSALRRGPNAYAHVTSSSCEDTACKA